MQSVRRDQADVAGYLGLSPVVISGNVVTRVPQLAHALPVKQVLLTVKCYEVRTESGLNPNLENTLWEKTKRIWQPPEGEEYVELGEWEYPFKITVPADAIESACSEQYTKEWKVVWRLEVSIDHKPIAYVGNRISKAYALALYNHRVPAIPPMSPPSAIHIGSGSTAAQVFLTAPPGAFGPSDFVNVNFHTAPADSSCSFRKASVVLERKIEYLGEKSLPGQDVRDVSPDRFRHRFTSFLRRGSSPRLDSSGRVPSESPPLVEVSGRVVTTKILEEAFPELVPGSGSTTWGSVSIQLPKRGGTWDIGETTQTKLVKVWFELRLKLTVRSASGQTKECSAGGIPVFVMGVSTDGRSRASAVIDAANKAKPHPTKRKHRSSRRGLYMHEGTIDISDPIVSGRRRIRAPKTVSSSPRLAQIPTITQITGIATDVKSILQASAKSQDAPSSISFAPAPSLDREGPQRHTASSISSLLNPSDVTPRAYPLHLVDPELHTTTRSTVPVRRPTSSSTSTSLNTPPPISVQLVPTATTDEPDSYSLFRDFATSGRRISNTSTEDEAIQPSRSRQKTTDVRADATYLPLGLPSLSALGRGLPQVPEEQRPMSRPRTAPVHSTFAVRRPASSSGATFGKFPSAHLAPRPITSMGRIPSGDALDEMEEAPFAFAVDDPY